MHGRETKYLRGFAVIIIIANYMLLKNGWEHTATYDILDWIVIVIYIIISVLLAVFLWRKGGRCYVKTTNMTGRDYEYFVANYLKKHGFKNVQVTKASGDFGVDITAYKRKNKYAIQCKYYTNPVSLDAIQEVVAGKSYYGCNKAMVVTNNTFTENAVKLARQNGVILLDYVS
jgi:restriction system protein